MRKTRQSCSFMSKERNIFSLEKKKRKEKNRRKRLKKRESRTFLSREQPRRCVLGQSLAASWSRQSHQRQIGWRRCERGKREGAGRGEIGNGGAGGSSGGPAVSCACTEGIQPKVKAGVDWNV